MTSARTAFIIAAIPFTVMAALWLFLDGGSSRAGSGWVFALCGGTFIYGSIFALRGELPLSSLMLVGLILNIIGAVVWIPAFGYHSGNSLGFIGVGLAAFWAKAIHSAYREESH